MPAINLPSVNFDEHDFKNKETMLQILDTLQKYRKELNFLLMNLDSDNMPSVIGRIEDGEGNMSQILQTIDGIQMTVANQAGDISNLQITADNISAAVADNAGNISQLSLRANAISSIVANQAGDISQLQQTATSIQSIVSSHAGEISSIKQTASGIQTQVTNNSNKISTVTQTVNGLQSTVSYQGEQLSGFRSDIRQMSNEISLKVSQRDYNGREIISLIEQAPSYIKLQAERIELDGIVNVNRYLNLGSGRESYSSLTFGRYADIQYDRGDLDISTDGAITLFATSGLVFNSYAMFYDDVAFYGDVEGMVNSYYPTNWFYLDYDGGRTIAVRDKRGRFMGYLDIT